MRLNSTNRHRKSSSGRRKLYNGRTHTDVRFNLKILRKYIRQKIFETTLNLNIL